MVAEVVQMCSKELIDQATDVCGYVSQYCGDQYKFLDFFDFYYCTLDQSVPLLVLVTILFVLFVFNLLGTTADRYLSPSLEVLSEKLKMSETIAGVTLVALANGACDVIAGIVAGGKESGGVQIAIGAIFGGCLFTITCVLARCIQATGFIQSDSGSIKRDISFLIAGICYFLFLTAINKITPLLACGFFVIYALYFCYVVYQERKKRAPKETVKEQFLKIRHDFLEASAKVESERLPELSDSTPMLRKSKLKKHFHRVKSFDLSRQRPLEEPGRLIPVAFNIDSPKINEESELVLEEEDDETTRFGRIKAMYNKPFLFIRDLTMLPFEEKHWNYWKAICAPILGILFILWQFDILEYMQGKWYLWLGLAVICGVPTFWIIWRGRNENLAIRHAGKFAVFTFVVSAMWLTFIANIFMDFLSLLTVASALPLEYLSLTMLAWGNSLDDFFIDYVICKAGHGKMAVTGLYAGQMFNVLVGIGGAMLRRSFIGTVHPNIYDFSGNFLSSLLTVVLLSSLVTCLVLTLFIARISKWGFNKKMMTFVLTFYSVFMIGVTLISVL